MPESINELKIDVEELKAKMKKLHSAFNDFSPKRSKLAHRIIKFEKGDAQYSAIGKYVGKYLSLTGDDFKKPIEQELHEDRIILYKRLQNFLGNLAPFRRDKKGATFALKRTIEIFIKQGFLNEMDSDEMKATYGTAQRAFKII